MSHLGGPPISPPRGPSKSNNVAPKRKKVSERGVAFETYEHLFGELLKDGSFIAAELESTAKALEARAAELRPWADRERTRMRNWDRHKQTVARIPALYDRALRDHVNDPVDHVARASGIYPECVPAWLAAFGRGQEQYKREQRDRESVALARRGLTNREIGERVGMHHGSVRRIIEAQFRGDEIRAVPPGD